MNKQTTKMIKLFHEINESELTATSINFRICHSIRVANMMYEFGRKMKLSGDIINQLYLTGLYHDICKSKPNHGLAAAKYLSKRKKKEFTSDMIEAIQIHSMKTSDLMSLSIYSKLLMDCDMLDKCTIDAIIFKLSKCDNISDKYQTLLYIQKMLEKYKFNFRETKEKYLSMKGLLEIIIKEYENMFI